MGTTLDSAKVGWLEKMTGLRLRHDDPVVDPAVLASLPTGTVAPPAAPKTPDEERADLERRLQKSGALYKQYGPAADEMLPVADRLTVAEQKIGGVYVERGRDVNLSGKDAVTSVSEKGVTVKTTASVTANTVGADGKVAEFSRERSSAVTVGPTAASKTDSATTTTNTGGVKTVDNTSTTTGIDLVAGSAARTTSTSTTVTDAATKTTTIDKTSTTVGTDGATRTREASTQVGAQLDGTKSTVGVTRSEGQLSLGGSYGAKSGTMTGPADKQVMEKGAEVTGKGGAGIVSDGTGTGLGGNLGADSKLALGHGLGLTGAVGGNGACTSQVVQVPKSDPPLFDITTTITFGVSASVGGSGERAPKADDTKGADTKGSVTLGASASLAASASFTRRLKGNEAQAYLEAVQHNGSGGKFPEHQVLATGMSQGWPAAQRLWASMNGGAEQARSLKAGESVSRSTAVSTGQSVGVSGSETREGGLAVGGSYSRSQSHAVTVKKDGLPDGRIQVTATVMDAAGSAGKGTVGYGVVSGSGGASHDEMKARTVVFTLDPKSKEFDGLIKQIDAASTAAEIDRIAAANKKALASTTDVTQVSDGSSAGLSVAGLSVELSGKGVGTHEETKDADGKVTQTKDTGSSQTGGTFGVGSIKVGDSETQAYSGTVKGGKATGEISDQHTSSSFSKTMDNVAHAASDPLGAVLHPGKLVGSQTDTQGTAVADPEIMAIVGDAMNAQKWNGKVGGHRMDEWIATGKKIRAAVTVKDGQIVAVDKSAVQKAMAEWTKGDDGGRTEQLDALVRPLGGMPTGKAFAFPDGTESFKPEWDALVIADPLEAVAGLSDKPAEALAAVKDVQRRLIQLSSGMKSSSQKWQGFEIQHAEMLGHVNDRLAEVTKRIRAMQPKPGAAAPGTAQGAGAATPKPQIGPPTPAQAQEADAAEAQRREDFKSDLQQYNDNIQQMKEYANAVFGILNKAEARLKDDGIFSDNAITRLLDAGKMVKLAEDQIKIWDKLYWPTYALYEKLSKQAQGLDKSRLEKVHVAGAQARCKQVYDMTRDTSMAGRM